MQQSTKLLFKTFLVSLLAIQTVTTAKEEAKRKMLVVAVDIQNDFCKGGALGISKANKEYQADVKVVTEAFQALGAAIAVSEDCHPAGHVSFASSYLDGKPFTRKLLPNGKEQDLWPDHCKQGEPGAETIIDKKTADLVVAKGTTVDTDCYSAVSQEMVKYISDNGITDVVVFGLATDYCVGATASDLIKLGFNGTNGKNLYVVENLTHGVSPEQSLKTLQELQANGAQLWYLKGVSDKRREITERDALEKLSLPVTAVPHPLSVLKKGNRLATYFAATQKTRAAIS